jgi:hypothetical protein
VAPYDEAWPSLFEKERTALVLGDAPGWVQPSMVTGLGRIKVAEPQTRRTVVDLVGAIRYYSRA